MAAASNDHQFLRDTVINLLSELFGSTLKLEVIKSVAQNCEYDVAVASNHLLELTNGSYQTKSGPNERGALNRKTSTPHSTSKDMYSPNTMDEQYQKELNLERLIKVVKEGWKVLILLRGLPGSGKSYIAQIIFNETVNSYSTKDFILSTDDYFSKSGVYSYRPDELESAHQWNQRRCFRSMRKGLSPIMIDNTNLRLWEMKSYCLMAAEFGYCIEILEPTTRWARVPQALAEKNVHQVPQAKIADMLSRYENNITPDMLSVCFDLHYKHPLPQYRSFPPLEPKRQVHAAAAVTWQVTNNNVEGDAWNSRTRVYPTFEVDSMKREIPAFKKKEMPMEYVHSFETKVVAAEEPKEYVHKFETHNDEVEKCGSNEEKSSQQNIDDLLMLGVKDNSSSSKLDSDVISSGGDNLTKNVCPDLPAVQNITKQVNAPANFNVVPSALADLISGEIKNIVFNPAALRSPMRKLNTTSDYEISAELKREDLSKNNLGTNTLKNNEEVDKKARSENPYPASNLEAWGLTEKALVSWDVVTPLSVKSPPPEPTVLVLRPATVQKSDQSTNTSSTDFKLAMQGIPEQGGRVLISQNRNITLGILPKPLFPPKKTLLDKSSMTNEEVLTAALKRGNQLPEHLDKLNQLFPGVPKEYLVDIYDKCLRDINWTVDLLMDDGPGHLSTLYDSGERNDKEEDAKINSNEQGKPDEEIDNDLISFEPIPATEAQSPGTENQEKIDKEAQKQQERELLKKYLEQTVDLKKEHYSDHIWQIKNGKRGTPLQSTDMEVEEAPSTSRTEVASSNSVVELTCSRTIAISDEECDLSSFDDGNDGENLVEINLGQDLVQQLEKLFGDSEVNGFDPVVQMPESFARQLHALYLESVCRQTENQYEAMEVALKEDEAFAKRLQEEEEQTLVQQQQVSGFKEIMDEQLALNLYQRDVDQWKNLSPDDLASRLTKQKLFEAFPIIEKDLLVEILQAHNNCYRQTVNTLLDSTDPKNIRGNRENLREPPISESTLQEMKSAQEAVNEVPPDGNEIISGVSYRKRANEHMCKRREHLQKIQTYQQRGMPEVAGFYSGLAKKELQLAELANHKASCRFLEENAVRMSNGVTLDLHSLYVKEALQTLDIFVDHQISNLMENKKASETLYIVTGRGNGSLRGPRLKPAVMTRLSKRNIRYQQVNPGLLRVKVHRSMRMSTNLERPF